MFPVSVGSAAGALCGEALGRGDPRRAAAILRAACGLVLLMVAAYTLPLVLVGRGAVADLLSGGVPQVKAAYASALPLILSMHLLDVCRGEAQTSTSHRPPDLPNLRLKRLSAPDAGTGPLQRLQGVAHRARQAGLRRRHVARHLLLRRRPSMVKVAVLARPWLASTGSSDCI